ncbi:MAG: N-acetylglucosamine kinase [Gaiellaceae bacterium]
MSDRLVLAIDGGGSKTDLALARVDGELLALVRGPVSSPQTLGFERSLETLSELARRACLGAGLVPPPEPLAELAQISLSGLDYPSEEESFLALAAGRGWGAKTLVGNDTLAVLRAGSDTGRGVAVVCGSGINCVGVAPDGRRVRFAAVGEISGEWGGGFDIGLAALSAAVRSEDGRGPSTTLEEKLPARFGLTRPLEVTEAIHFERLAQERLAELAPLVLDEAASDPAAAAIVDRLAGEVVAFARAALIQLELTNEPLEVILGGSILQAGNARLLKAIEAGMREIGPAIGARVNEAPPIVGAALLALDEIGAKTEAKKRLRQEIVEAVRRL